MWLQLVRALLAAYLKVPIEQVVSQGFGKANSLIPPEFRGWAGHLTALLDGTNMQAISPRHLQAECEMVVKFVSGLIRSGAKPQLVLIDAAENLTSYAWQIISGILDAPSVAVIVAARDLATWCEDGSHGWRVH